MDYELTPTFKRRYKRKELRAQESVEATIQTLIDNPKHPGLRAHKVLRAGGKIFEAYIDGSTRLTFEYGKDKIIFRNNCNHDQVINNP